MKFRSHVRRGFTLVELLVVIGIIAVLIAILLPSLNAARGSAKLIACQSNMRQIATATLMYAAEQKNWLPSGCDLSDPNGSFRTTWAHRLIDGRYLPTPSRQDADPSTSGFFSKLDQPIFTCPQNRRKDFLDAIQYRPSLFLFGCNPKPGDWRMTKLTDLSTSSRVVMYAESNRGRPNYEPQTWNWNASTQGTRYSWYFPHGKDGARRINLVFADGHVQTFRYRGAMDGTAFLSALADPDALYPNAIHTRAHLGLVQKW